MIAGVSVPGVDGYSGGSLRLWCSIYCVKKLGMSANYFVSAHFFFGVLTNVEKFE